jgi:hypothetical protein
MTDPLAHSKLKDAIRAIPPDKRPQEIESALRKVEKEERDQKLQERFDNLPTEDKALYGNIRRDDKKPEGSA